MKRIPVYVVETLSLFKTFTKGNPGIDLSQMSHKVIFLIYL